LPFRVYFLPGPQVVIHVVKRHVVKRLTNLLFTITLNSIGYYALYIITVQTEQAINLLVYGAGPPNAAVDV